MCLEHIGKQEISLGFRSDQASSTNINDNILVLRLHVGGRGEIGRGNRLGARKWGSGALVRERKVALRRAGRVCCQERKRRVLVRDGLFKTLFFRSWGLKCGDCRNDVRLSRRRHSLRAFASTCTRFGSGGVFQWSESF